MTAGTPSALQQPMHSTFVQKIFICMATGFLAACLIQWTHVFVDGADDALNGEYRKKEISLPP